jgi:hypothetical protein
MAHRGGRIIDTDLSISHLLQVSSENQERKQGSEDNPNVNAHHSTPATAAAVKQLGVAAAAKEGSARHRAGLYLVCFLGGVAPASNEGFFFERKVAKVFVN